MKQSPIPDPGSPPERESSGAPVAFQEEVNRFANTLPVFFAYVGADQRHRVANQAYERWFGRDPGGLRGVHLRELFGDEAYASVRRHVDAVLSGQKVSCEVALPRPGGGTRFVEATWAPRVDATGEVRGFFALLIDITAHKRADEALRAIMEGTARDTGDDFFQSLVRHLAAALEVGIAFVAEVKEPTASVANVQALWQNDRLLEGFEYALAGTPCEHVVGRALTFFPDHVQELFPDDQWLRDVDARSYLAVPFFDARGRAIGHMGVLDSRPMIDEHRKTSILRVFAARAGAELERKRTEQALRERDEQLRQSQKMEAIGTFASGIAHDLGNMLGAIRGYTELALPGIPAGTRAHENLREVLLAADRARGFAQQILLFARPEEGPRGLVRLRAAVDEVLGLVRASLPLTVSIRRHILTEQDEVWADADQVRRMLHNLCANAGQAMPGGGVIEVTVDRLVGSPAYRTAVGALEARPYVRLTVADTGHGIHPDVLPHVFEPFFTTKARGDGSGLGLALVERIVAGHDGAITVRTTRGEGTAFEVLLPHSTAQPVAREEQVRSGSGRVLVVDDDVAFVGAQARLLESLGYEAVTCTSGAEALAVFAAAPATFVAAVTDRSMPGMTGDVLATNLCAIRPDLPVVLCTAFNDGGPEGAPSTVRARLTKPSSRRELGDVLWLVIHLGSPRSA